MNRMHNSDYYAYFYFTGSSSKGNCRYGIGESGLLPVARSDATPTTPQSGPVGPDSSPFRSRAFLRKRHCGTAPRAARDLTGGTMFLP